MCASCGCGEPNEMHGDQRHISLDQIQQAAKAAEISPQEAAKNMMDCVQQFGGSTGQMGAGAGESSQASASA